MKAYMKVDLPSCINVSAQCHTSYPTDRSMSICEKIVVPCSSQIYALWFLTKADAHVNSTSTELCSSESTASACFPVCFPVVSVGFSVAATSMACNFLYSIPLDKWIWGCHSNCRPEAAVVDQVSALVTLIEHRITVMWRLLLL